MPGDSVAKWSLVLALLASGLANAAAPNPYLVHAKVLHQGLEFEKCIKRLNAASNWPTSSTSEQAEIELYHALCLLGLSRDTQAAEHFEMALRIDRNIELPPLQGPRIVAEFNKVKARVIAQLGPDAVEPAPTPQPPPVVTAPPVVAPPPTDTPTAPKLEPTPAPPKASDLVTPPVKQQRFAFLRTTIFGGVTVAMALTAVLFGVLAQDSAKKANDARFQDDSLAIGQRARTEALTSTIGWSLAGAAAVGTIAFLIVDAITAGNP